MTGSGIATVARQEFRLRIRAGRWKLLLAIFFAVLLGFTLLLRGALGSLAANQLPFQGTVLYGGLMLFVLGLALLVVPALAAQSVNGDRERGTLATLQVTRLTAAEITLGKFVAAWGTALVFLALTFPLVAYAMTQGGVPFGRVVVVTLVLAVLLGTVCAISLWLSSVLSRTTTSGVLAYLSVFGLALGTLIVFGLVTAVTAETVQEPQISCTGGGPGPNGSFVQPDCRPVPGEFYETTRTRTDRTWWLLAPNPFVVLADAAPQLPALAPRDGEGFSSGVRARDLDPLGQIGSTVRDLRRPPSDSGIAFGFQVGENRQERPGAVWPTGLAVNIVLAAGALLLTTRRLRTPSRTLPRGQRVA
ncbi:MAG: ABC transporter permease [Frankiales bacterium]|nr:ABC transporter permease [Frankiales bacterium]